MKIHEYQAKAILAAHGVPVPQGEVVFNAAEARAAAVNLGGGTVVVKAQIHAGGRGKGGGVKVVKGPDAAEEAAKAMIGMRLVTIQTGAEGQVVERVLVEQGLAIKRELYLGIVLDRASEKPVLMVSQDGGVEIEKVAHETPERIFKEFIHPGVGLSGYQTRKLAFALGLQGPQIAQAGKLMTAVYETFKSTDASLIEINPLIVTEDGSLLALDAKMNFDDNALYRHADIKALRDMAEEAPLEVEASKFSLNYIKLDGTVGCMVNGAGLAMATMDIINYHGKAKGVGPANFLDVGGSVTADGAIEAFRIILSDPKVKGILVNVFGGIASCATIAEALVKAGKEVGFKVPVVVRLEGNEVEKARAILAGAAAELPTLKTAADLTSAAKMVVELSK